MHLEKHQLEASLGKEVENAFKIDNRAIEGKRKKESIALFSCF